MVLAIKLSFSGGAKLMYYVTLAIRGQGQIFKVIL